MVVSLIAAAQLLLYLCAVPVNLAFRVDAAEGLRFGTGLSAFDRRAALKRAAKRLVRGARGHKNRSHSSENAWAMAQRIRLRGIRVGGVIALGDAAATALACGAAQALACSLRSRTAHMTLDIRADFAADAFRLDLRGMLSAHAGQIILAAIRSLPRREGGRIHGQTSH